MWRLASIAVVVLVIASAAVATSRSESPQADHKPADAQSSKEFHDQIYAIIRAHRAGSAEFTERYERHFTRFADALEQTIEDIAANRGAELETKPELGQGETP